MNDWRTCNWYRRCAVFAAVVGLIVVGLACGNREQTPAVPADAVAVAKFPTQPSGPVVIPKDARHVYYEGYLADVLAGDQKFAEGRYREVLGYGAEEPTLVAFAALRLAGWAERRGDRRVAMDLAVRASVLGADMPRVKAQADKLRRRATTVRSQDIQLRGLRAGTVLRGVGPGVAAQFTAAEKLLKVYHRRRLQPHIEALVASVRGKRSAMESAVDAYRQVIASGHATAIVAAEFRIASLRYDFSLALTFELPGELASEVATRMRSSLSSEVRQMLAKAKAAYRRSLAAASRAGPEAKPWSEASGLGLALVEDLLRSGN